MVRQQGFEPRTVGLEGRSSTLVLLHPQDTRGPSVDRLDAAAVTFVEAVDARDPHVIARGLDMVRAWHDLRAEVVGDEGAEPQHEGGAS